MDGGRNECVHLFAAAVHSTHSPRTRHSAARDCADPAPDL
jgi:hypothetical protein